MTDIAVIGAGPAGMAAAIAARKAGLSVVVLDEQPGPGGQIYRNVLDSDARRGAILGSDYTEGAQLAGAFTRCGAGHLRAASVWQVTRDRHIHYVQDGIAKEVAARAVILCTGAMERPFPVPGWTLPGVMTAGAGQILLKGSGVVPSVPVVLAGRGPLLYLLALQYLRAGVRIAAVLETGHPLDMLRALPLLPGALRDPKLLAKGWGMLRALRASGTKIFRGAGALAIEGDSAARAIRFRCATGEQRIEAGLFLLHQGVVPNTQVTHSLRADHAWDEGQACFRPVLGSRGALHGLPGFFVAGDGARIMGAAASAVSGERAGLAAAASLQGGTALDVGVANAERRLAALQRARPFIDALYRPRREHRVPADAVLVCRCEEITAGEIRQHVRAGCVGPNQLKSFTRCGMGPCQGRQCGLTVSEIIAHERRLPPDQVGYQRVRPPLKPITLGELADLASDA